VCYGIDIKPTGTAASTFYKVSRSVCMARFQEDEGFGGRFISSSHALERYVTRISHLFILSPICKRGFRIYLICDDRKMWICVLIISKLHFIVLLTIQIEFNNVHIIHISFLLHNAEREIILNRVHNHPSIKWMK